MDDSLFSDQPAPKDAGLFSNEPAPKQVGGMESFARGAANNFPLAPQAIAAVEPGDYSKNMADWKGSASNAKAQNPISYGAGAVTGAAAPLLIPGVGEAMEASPLMTNAALGAANAVSDTDLSKNPEGTLKQAADGAGTGLIAGKLGSMLPGKAAIADVANDARAQALNLSPKLLKSLTPQQLTEYGQFGKDIGAVGTNVDAQTAVDKARAALEDAGQQIHASGAHALPLDDANQYTQPLLAKYEEMMAIPHPEAQKQANELLRGAMNIEQAGTTFGDLQKLKGFYGDQAFDGAHQVKNQAAADVYGQIREAMRDMAANAPENYGSALKNYKMAHDIEGGLTERLGQERAGKVQNAIGMVGRLVGKFPGQSNPAINVPTAAAIAALGHPMMAVGAAMPTISNPAVRAAATELGGKAIPAVAPEMNDFFASKLKEDER